MSANVVRFRSVPGRTTKPHVGPTAAAMPFVKWAGGKRSLIPAIARHFPDSVETYWEPFVGGGAVFFTFAGRIEKAILSDTNKELVTTYRMVKSHVDDLIERLGKHEALHRRYGGRAGKNGKTYYYRVRAEKPTDDVGVAARLIYLNKTCFNGLYRVNQSGWFNVPEGSYQNPDICNAERLLTASAALARATIEVGDFERIVKPGKDDLIYCDPPYDGTFSSYQKDGFDDDAQRRLKEAAVQWKASGANVMLSNADTPAMRKLYAGFEIETVHAPRFINSDGNGRNKTAELLMR